MMSQRLFLYCLVLLFSVISSLGLISGCRSKNLEISAPSVEQNKGQLSVYVTSYPLKYFTERIAGNTIMVNYLVPDGIDPALWQPKSTDIAQMHMGDLIFINGASYEKWLEQVSLADSKLINTSAGFQDQYIKTQEAFIHAHGPEGEHAHTQIASMTWLNLEFAIAQANIIRSTLTDVLPNLSKTFEENFTVLKHDLQRLDKQLKTITAANPELPLIASQPIYDYLAQRYGLNLQSLSWQPDKVPDEVQWEQLKKRLKEHPAQSMIWEEQPNAETVTKLKSLGIESLVFDPLDKTPQNSDFIEAMQRNIQNLKQLHEKRRSSKVSF